jgi:ATP synthase I chain
MTDPLNPEAPAESAQMDSFYSRAVPRMLRTMLIVSALLLFPIFWFYGWAGVIGVMAGSLVAYINFRALASGVESLADRIVNRHSKEKGRVIVIRFLLRYGLVGAVAYAIFKSSGLAFRGFLWGLCLPVAAMMVEAGVEAYVAFRQN